MKLLKKHNIQSYSQNQGSTYMNKSLVAAGFGILLATSALSSAQANERWPRWYLGLSGGYTTMTDQDISSSTGASQVSLNSGYSFGGSVGYLPSSSAPILNALRLEAEVTHHTNDIDSVTVSGASVAGSGDFSTTAYMANVFYDFPTNSAWSPYVGAGLGLASLHFSRSSGAGNSDETTTEFAYQAMLGMGYTPASLPNTQWSLGYRYLATSDASFGNASVEYSTHSIEVGAKFRF
jgi:opacity protein-like surface antigen